MSPSNLIQVRGRDGILGVIDPGDQPKDQLQAQIRLEDGNTVQVPVDLLVPLEDGSYYLPMSAEQFRPASTSGGKTGTIVIPVIVEDLEVGKRQVSQTVRFRKEVHEREEVVDEPAFREVVDVERIPINQEVTEAPKARYEGEVLVIPVLEEVLVVEKHLVLKEEVRITRRREETHDPKRVTLRSEEVKIERPDEKDDSTGGIQ